MDDGRRKRNAKTFVRILPSSNFSHENIKVELDFKTLHVRCLQDFLPGKDHDQAPPEYWRFATDGIFYKATQDDVYSTVMDGVLDLVLAGAEALLVCYGQAGSGKSYTSFGITSEFQERGLGPRIIAALFDEKTSRQSSIMQVTVSCVEFLGQELVDLLQTEDRYAQSGNHNKTVLSVPVENEEGAMKLLFEGVGQRAVCDEAPHLGANRGHGVLTIRVENRSTVKSRPSITSGTLHLVDLAGISSPGKNSWSRPQDIGAANLTKTFLEQVLILLGNTCQMKAMLSQQLVCPLIRYVGNALSNVAVMRFIGHIRGLRKDLELTLSTLRFSEKVDALKCTMLNFHTEPHPKLVLENFEDEVAGLQKQLEESTMLARESNQTNISQARVEHLRRLVTSYLEGESSAETIMALQQTPLAMAVFREELDKLRADTAIVEYKIEHMQFDDFRKTPTSSARQSRISQNRMSPTSQTGSLGKEGRGKGKGSSTESKNLVRGPSLASKAELKKKGAESKESVKKQAKSPRDSTHSITTSKDKFKKPDSKDGLRDTVSASSTAAGKASNSSSKRVKRVGSLANKKGSHNKGGKSKEGLSKLDELSTTEIDPDVVEESPEKPIVLPSTPLPPHEAAWESFIATDVGEMRAAASQAKLDTEQAHICYSRAVVRLTEARLAAVLACSDLVETQHRRQLQGHEAYGLDGRVATGDSEQRALLEHRRKKANVDVRLEALKSAKVELDECVERLSETTRALEDRFEEFCLATYQAPIPYVEVENKDLMKPNEVDDITEHRIKHFHILQKMFFSSSTMCNKHQV